MPTVMVASGAPAFAASGGPIVLSDTSAAYPGDHYDPITITVSPAAAVEVELSVPAPFYFADTRADGPVVNPGTATADPPPEKTFETEPAADPDGSADLSGRAGTARTITVTTAPDGTYTLTHQLVLSLGSVSETPATPVITGRRTDTSATDTCILQVRGNVAYAWGYNGWRALGDGDITADRCSRERCSLPGCP